MYQRPSVPVTNPIVRAGPPPRTTAAPDRAPPAGRRRGRPTSRSDARHAFEAESGAEQRRQDLAERPRPGEFPALVVVGDRQAVDVLGRPAPRGLGPAEVVVVGGDPAAVLVDVEQPLGRMALEEDEPAVGASSRRSDRRPGVEVLEPHQRAAARVEEVGRPVELMRRRRGRPHSIQRAGAPVAAGQALRRARASAG